MPIITKFNKRDKFDTADCQMHTVSGRNQFESALRQNTISANGIKMMIDSNPILEIQIYQTDLKVRVIQNKKQGGSKGRLNCLMV